MEERSMSDKPEVIPTGLEHLALIRRGAIYVANETAKNIDDFKINNDIVGTALSALDGSAGGGGGRGRP